MADIITIRDVLEDSKRRIAPVSTSASLDAQLLLAEVLQVSRAHVIAHPEKHLTPEQAAQIETLVNRRAAGEPIAYILGRRAFYDRDFTVTPAVLIPRPETEQLLELALEFVRERPQSTVVDCGTGSGALAVTLAAHAPDAAVYATDISPHALEVARQNAAMHHVNVTFFEGDLLTPLIEQRIRVDLIMANLPYIATDVMFDLDVSRYEPRLALDGGRDGLDLVRRLLSQVAQVCKPGALILLEIGFDQGEMTRTLAEGILSRVSVHVIKDFAGHDRIVRIETT